VDITAHASSNFADRRGGATPDLIVLHYTAMDTAAAALERLCDPEHEVSAHYLITGQGEIFQLVPEDKRAWHAGAGAWGACGDVNSRSIGIELANDGCSPFAAAQMDALERLLVDIKTRWPVPPERIIGHSDMTPQRKSDPGPRFDWHRLALAGHSVWPQAPDPQPVNEEKFFANATAFGYPRADDLQTLLSAVRRRFRPGAAGEIDGIDMGLIGDLARRFPVDQSGI